MLETLARWNRWGSATLPAKRPRDVTARVASFLDPPEVVGLVGPRRAGKTTVVHQLIDALERRGVSRQAVLHVDLEEPAFAADLGPGLLDVIYDTYRQRVCPNGRAWVFLDEVQRVAGWERWVRARSETEDIRVVVTGSSSAMMSRELGTLLTGRHVTFDVHPLSFREFLGFRDVAPPDRPDLAGSPAPVVYAMHDYLRWGGFPEVALASDPVRRRALLRQYFDDLLYRDVALRHPIRDLPTLRGLAAHLLACTAQTVTYRRLANVFGVSPSLMKDYCAYLEEAFLVRFLPFDTRKAGVRQRNPLKVHAVDLGLRHVVARSDTPDLGHIAQTAAAAALARSDTTRLTWWRADREIDLVARDEAGTVELVQVAWRVDAPDTLARELAALGDAAARSPAARALLVVGEGPVPKLDGVTALPLWRLLLERS